ncbi:MAG: hypothetical protein R2939_07215 [Kofleriaceae bacterium]
MARRRVPGSVAMVAASVLAAAGCSRRATDTPPAHDRAAPGRDAARAAAIEIVVDGTAQGHLAPARITGRVRLQHAPGAPALPAPSLWRSITATAGGRTLHLDELDQRYADVRLELFVADGRVGIGAFRLPRPDAPAHVVAALATPTVSLLGVERIELDTGAAAAAEAAEPLGSSITLAIGAESRTVTPAELATLAVVPPPPVADRGEKRSGPGWPLAAVVGLAKRADLELVSVEVTAAEGPLTVTAAELARSELAFLLRYNRRGQLALQAWSAAAAAPTRTLRGVSRIDVLTR